jgi:hypothetical protein
VQLSVEAPAKANQVAVILNSRAEYSVKHNDVHADDAELMIVAPSAPAQPPAAAPAPARLAQPLVTVTGTTAIRAQPDAAARILRRAPRASTLRVRGISRDGAWWRVTLANNSATLGWVPAADVQANSSAEQLRAAPDATAQALVRLNVRATPSSSARSTGIIAPGTALPVVGKSANGLWWLVSYAGAPNGQGWLPAASVAASAAADAAPVAP